jgi:diguanylate cyclase (GGDEF)-like protein/PAS domain S-box-containing protein
MSGEAATERRTSIASLVVYAMSPVGIAAYWYLRANDLLADTPVWLMGVFLLTASTANYVTTVWVTRRPDSLVRMHARAAASALATALVIYATGWGSMLVVAYAVGTAELLRTVGPTSWRPSLMWNLAAIVMGEVAVGLGIAPTMIDPNLGYALSFTAAACLVIVVKVLGDTAEAREAAETEVRERGEHFESLIRHAADMIGVVGHDLRIRSVSPAIAPMLGYEPAAVEHAPFAMLVHPGDIREVIELFSRVIATPGESITTELRLRHHDGTARLAWVTLTSPVEATDREIIVNLHDITTQRELEERLRHDAMHDALTGLLNRAAFLETLERATSRADREESSIALLYIDLDGFKGINDRLGHQVGDQVLIEASRRLRDGLRSGETVGRLGGDEFIVLVESVNHPGIPIEIADRLLRTLVAPMADVPDVDGLSASIGIAMRAPQVDDIEELMLSADQAMYTAKRSGRGRWAMAHDDLETAGDPVR